MLNNAYINSHSESHDTNLLEEGEAEHDDSATEMEMDTQVSDNSDSSSMEEASSSPRESKVAGYHRAPPPLPITNEQLRRYRCHEARAIAGQNIQSNLEDLKACELRYKVFNPAAEYVRYRRIVVDWMTEVGNECDLQPMTTHMAVNYLDRILGQTTVHKTRLQLVSLVCILVAAKHDEEPDYVPTIEKLNGCTNYAYSPELIKEMEILVLKCLDWHLNVVIPLHFLNLFNYCNIVFDNDDIDGGKPHTEAIILYTQKYAYFFADLCLQEYTFQQYPPSLLVAGILAAARRAVRIEPVWNANLKVMTGYGAREVHACCKHIYSHYEASFPNQSEARSLPEGNPNDVRTPPDVQAFENQRCISG